MYNGTDFASTLAASQTNKEQFIQPVAPPYNQVQPVSASTYSATDRTVQDATVKQKTLIVPTIGAIPYGSVASNAL